MARLQQTQITGSADPTLTMSTPNDYDGTSLRLVSKSQPTVYNLYINSTVTPGVVRWTFNQVNASTTYSNILSFHNGNVAMGTTDASYKLDVTGTMRATGDVGVGGANDGTTRLYVSGEALTEPYLSVNTCLGNNSTSTSPYAYTTLKGWLAIKIGNNVGTAGNLLNSGVAFTGYIRIWG